MNKEELVQEISKKAKVTQKEAAEVLGGLVETIQKTVSKGEKVTLVGFGLVKKLKLLLKQFLLFQLAKNSKNWLTKNKFFEMISLKVV